MFFWWIDPWYRKLWYAIVNDDLDIVEAGIVVHNLEKSRHSQIQRMLQTIDFVQDLMSKFPPRLIGMEKVFFSHQNQANAEFVFGLRGIIYFLAKESQILEYSPTQIKKYITGTGKANKLLMQQMIQKILGLEQIPQFDDAADALALAYLAFKKYQWR